MVHLCLWTGMLMTGGESTFIIQVPSPTSQGAGTSGGFLAAQQQVTESLQQEQPCLASLASRVPDCVGPG